MGIKLLLTLVIFFSCNFTIVKPTFSKEIKWKEVPETVYGQQWWDTQILKESKSGQITVKTKFIHNKEISNLSKRPLSSL